MGLKSDVDIKSCSESRCLNENIVLFPFKYLVSAMFAVTNFEILNFSETLLLIYWWSKTRLGFLSAIGNGLLWAFFQIGGDV